MKINVIQADLAEFKCDAVIVNLFEGVKTPGGATGAADKALGGEISKLIKSGEITGKLNETRVIHTFGKTAADRVLVAGLGKQEEFTLDKIRHVSAESAKALRRIGAKKIATIAHGAGIAGMDPQKACQALVEGTVLGLYRFRKYKSEKPENGSIDELSILELDKNKIKPLEEGAKTGRILAEATCLARDLVNEPANTLTPTELASRAKEVAKAFGMEYYDLDKDKVWELGMGAFLSVAQGSEQPPQFIVIRYDGANSSKPAIGLVGKGITFDSGGISIKPSQGMEEMKGDMAGAAAVLGAMQAIGQLKPKINVCAIIPATENMPSGKASRPGDVVKAMNGKTIEIISTDAEGRMVMADAICYAHKLGLKAVLDIATLTRACAIAIGPVCSGVFGNNKDLIDRVLKAGEESGEKMWQMPMHDEYKEMIKSDIADIKNVGGGYGGAITGAQFVGFFADKTPWVHLDIAGTSDGEKEQGYLSKGARGTGVRTIVSFVLSMS